MNYSFIGAALSELDEAAEYYDLQVEGLGGEFLREVDCAIDRICSFPEAWGKFQKITGIVLCSASPTPSLTQ